MSRRLRPVKDLSPWRRLAAGAYAAPHEGKIYGTIEIDAGQALRFLERQRAEGSRLGITHLVVRAAALALRDYVPELNRTIRRSRLYQRPTIDIFVNVGIRRGQDLTGFKIVGADEKSLDQIANEIQHGAQRLLRRKERVGVERARRALETIPPPLLRPTLQLLRLLVLELGLNLSPLGLPEDPFGGLVVTNIGKYGLGVGYPALLPLSGASCIIAIGQISERAVVRDGQIVARPILPLSGTFDHRIADAYHAGALVGAAQDLLEHPERL
jgi:pyruvate dehydrogenase E2 component (dihydrolipoamide acetyltransferase)